MKSLTLAAALALAACAVQPGGGSTTAGGSSASAGNSGGGTDAGCVSGKCSIGAVCNPAQLTDPCAAQGLACSPDYSTTSPSPTGAYCQVPGEYFDCLPSVGCAASLQCIGADDAGDPGGCFLPCATTADCWDPLTVCAPMEVGAPTYCVVNGCDDFWQTCSASSVSGADGTCVYVYDDPEYGPQGACLQGGAVPNGGACNYYRGVDAGLCVPGTLCMIDGNADNSGNCMAVCDGIADGGPACAGDCVPSEPPAPPPAVSALDFTQAGGCATPCSASSPDCPGALICYELNETGSLSACLP